MKKIIGIMIMTLTYPIWWLVCEVFDFMFYCHKELIKWIEK